MPALKTTTLLSLQREVDKLKSEVKDLREAVKILSVAAVERDENIKTALQLLSTQGAAISDFSAISIAAVLAVTHLGLQLRGQGAIKQQRLDNAVLLIEAAMKKTNGLLENAAPAIDLIKTWSEAAPDTTVN